MSTVFTLTPQRLAANRANAQKSTGPKTPEGKAKSAQNASTHGVYSAFLLQKAESEPVFIAFRNSLLESLCPKNLLELAQADRVISLHWRLRRLQEAENHLNQMQNLDYQKQLEAIQEQKEDRRYQLQDNLKKLKLSFTEEDLEEEDDSDALPPDPTPGFLLAQFLHQAAEDRHPRITPHERLLNIEIKLQSQLTKAHRELRQTQQERKKREDNNEETPHCIYVIHPDDLDTPHQADEDDNNNQDNGDNHDNENNKIEEPNQNNPDQATHSSTSDNGPRTTDKQRKIEPTCQFGTLTPLAQAAAQTAHSLTNHPPKGPK